jgi:hypothetical protein
MWARRKNVAVTRDLGTRSHTCATVNLMSGVGSPTAQKPFQYSIINCLPPSAIGRMLTADSIHREQQHDRR